MYAAAACIPGANVEKWLGAAWVACGFRSGWTIGPVTWFGDLSATAVVFAWLLSVSSRVEPDGSLQMRARLVAASCG